MQISAILTECDEVPSGAINGTNCIFITTYPAMKLDLYKNGDLQDVPTRSISGTSIILTVAPITGDELRVKYVY